MAFEQWHTDELNDKKAKAQAAGRLFFYVMGHTGRINALGEASVPLGMSLVPPLRVCSADAVFRVSFPPE